MKHKDVMVQKASGETEPFSVEKLIRSLQNTGAEQVEIEEVIHKIAGWINNGVTTHQIYARAYELLQQKRNYLASRYKLKKAIMELGPTGYPFEHFVAKLFEAMGFSVLTGQIMQGQCITHEMDVVATKNREEHLVECKYGQSQGKTVSVQVPLYVRSRIDDIIKQQKESAKYHEFSFFGWVVTNTRFSADAIEYGKCAGLQLLSWDFPRGKGMKDIIDQEKIYPITVLTHLTQKQKRYLLENGVVICRQLTSVPHLLPSLKLTPRQNHLLREELQNIT